MASFCHFSYLYSLKFPRKNRFYRLASMLILELITRKLSYYTPLYHFVPHYPAANSRKSTSIKQIWYFVSSICSPNWTKRSKKFFRCSRCCSINSENINISKYKTTNDMETIASVNVNGAPCNKFDILLYKHFNIIFML